MLSPASSQRILDWADDVSACAGDDQQQDNRAKRKLLSMADEDRTPRAAKRIRTGLHTPSLTYRSRDQDVEAAPTFPDSASESVSAASDNSRRSNSPLKRVRNSEIQSSKPELIPVPENKLSAWKAANRIESFPQLQELLRIGSISSNSLSDDIQAPESDERLEEIFNDYKNMPTEASEDYWSDYVVFPCLKLARSWAQTQDVRVIPVKTLDVSPTSLLPNNVRAGGPFKKRVDYTIGVEVAPFPTNIQIAHRAEGFSLAQSDHPQICDRVLCSHVEIKASPDPSTALSQLKTWCCAGFKKQERLWKTRPEDPTAALLDFKPAAQPLWIWEADKIKLLIAVLDSDNETIFFLTVRTFMLDQDSIKPLQKLVLVIAQVMVWGATKYLDWFRAEVLGKAELNPDCHPCIPSVATAA